MGITITVTPILTDTSRFDPNRLRKAIKPGILNPLVNITVGDFNSHVAHYSSSPTVEKEVREFDATVGVSDRFVTMVNFGTRPHVIRPRDPGGVLAFQIGYTPKTRPGVIPSRPGGRSGETVFARKVNHPGTEPRRVDLAVQQKNQPIAVRLARRTLQQVFGS